MANYRSRTFKNTDGDRVRVCTNCGRTKLLDVQHWGRTKNDPQGFQRVCKGCAQERNKARYQKQKSKGGGIERKLPEQKTPPQQKVITCSCGHDWKFDIERESMVEWLKKRPCPPCSMETQQPERKETPKQKAAREKKEEQAKKEEAKKAEEARKAEEEAREARIDRTWVDRMFNMLPDGELFHDAIIELLMALDAGLVVWLQGPPGTSKSTLAEQAARGIGANFYAMSCHEYMTESKLFGFVDANGVDHRTPFWDSFEYGGVLLLDEVDNGNPNLLAAMNSALSNGHCVFAGRHVVQRHPDFRVIATANTAGLGPEHGFIGRNGVDLATRDRFITLDVPIDGELEAALAALHMGEDVEDLGLSELFAQRAKTKLEQRSFNREDDLTSKRIVEVVQKMREAVDGRFRGQVVSPRASIHVAAMVKAGFTLREALRAKLPGVKPSEMSTVVEEAMR